MINRDSAFIIGSYVAGCIARTERLPEAGETVLANTFILQPGGKGFNLLAGLHRLGAAVDGILPIGDDLWGRMSAQLFDDLHLPRTWLLPLHGPSGGAVGLVDAAGENRIAIAPGTNGLMSAAHLAPVQPRIMQAKIVAGQFETADEPLIFAFAVAQKNGAQTLLNPSPYRPIQAKLLAVTDTIILNRTEATMLARQFETPHREMREPADFRLLAQQLHAHGICLVIITLGAAGSVAFHQSGGEYVQPAYPITVVDTTGAGDAYTAGLIAALLDHKPLADALRQAAACGSLVSRGPGVLDNLPDADEVSSFLSNHGTILPDCAAKTVPQLPA